MKVSPRYEERTVAARKWEPLRLEHVGQVGELMRTNVTGSKRDGSQGCGSNQARRRTFPTGTPC